jgi:hypothetical protein
MVVRPATIQVMRSTRAMCWGPAFFTLGQGCTGLSVV